MSKLRFFILGVLFLLLFAVAPGRAQTSRGTLTGVVTDSSGAVVAKAAVTITQSGTNLKRETTTNEAGLYRFDAVDLGTYSLSVHATGFRTKDTTGVAIEAAHTTNIDVTLEVGTASETVTVEASAFEVQLQTSEQVRGANFSDRTVENLPITGLDSLTLTQLLPGVVTANRGPASNINEDGTFAFSVNGQRPRGNNFMIDGVENNDISIAGPAYTITNPDAVEEVNIQTSNFSAEFGRAGGAVINQITKSGTNQLHGTATYDYTGSVFRALSNVQKAAGFVDPPRQVENIPDFTIGGPVVLPHLYNGHDKTFFFAAAQWDRLFGDTSGRNLRIPTDAGVATLQALASQCPNAALYLQALGSLRGDPNNSPASISLAVPSAAGTCDNSTRAGMGLATGLFVRKQSFSSLDNNHQIRIDHRVSDKQNMSFRWLYDSSVVGPTLNNLPGFDNNFTGLTLTGTFTDTYVINSKWTNEFRFNYGRIGFNFPLAAPDTFHGTLANYAISGVAGFGGATNIPQFRFANNWQYEDTMSYVHGTHTFRFGGDFLRQLARQHPPFNERGSFTYAVSTGVTGFSNFLDDFGGGGGSLNRQFGSSIYHPNLFRQSYFFQDSWKTTQNLTLNLGLRYENFGTPVNTFSVAAFTNYDPVNFAAPHPVPGDNNNFAPTVGFAWNPKGDHLLDRMMGGKHMVWRGGFQTSYDTWFNNLLSNIAGSSPNTLGGTIQSTVPKGSASRGTANFSTQFAGIQPTPPTALSPQSNLFLLPFRNPYTDRWSLGFEREMPFGLIWDSSYVGSVSHKLFRSIDMNPIVNAATGARFMPQVGVRTVRATSANSNYESFQAELKRPFKATFVGDLQFDGSYTYGHYLDEISDVFGFDSTPTSFQSVSQVVGGSRHLDYGNSDFDRRHVGSLGLVWGVRGPKRGLVGSLVGGWQLSAIAILQSGIPYTLLNGFDRNGDGQLVPDRPDIGSASAPLNTRAILQASCATGYANPDLVGTPCVSPTSVHFIEGTGLPNANTVGRNTLHLPGLDNIDLAAAKTFRFTERMNLELRLDMFNALNTLNLGYTTLGFGNGQDVATSALGTFLNQAQTPDDPRRMRVMARFSF
ncbi:MAG TPA: carboxypeptidase regulatory-like domain-containing protein [Candidatus Methylomirabilis sp.]|nr:carboxypeptidase regulatory-like domain-containing protein [Candidatus Methylomirabilis sp.]